MFSLGVDSNSFDFLYYTDLFSIWSHIIDLIHRRPRSEAKKERIHLRRVFCGFLLPNQWIIGLLGSVPVSARPR